MAVDPVSASGVPDSVDVAVIGAGAAGLTASYELGRAGIAHCVLERGQVGESWRSMSEALHLVSPWWTNALALRDLLWHRPFSLISAREYARYLEAFAGRFELPLVADCTVLRVTSPRTAGDRFLISTSRGEVGARAVICASGYFFGPAPPEPQPTSDGSVPVIHAAAFPGAERISQIARGAPVVIVGRRVSAGQLMVALAEHGVEVVLSVRSRAEFRRDDTLGRLKDFLYYFYEELLMALRPALKAPSFPVMDGGRSRQLVESGQVRVVAPIAMIRDRRVVLSDNTVIEAGMVINATGYRPAMAFLDHHDNLARAADGLPACEGWESVSTPGLFFLGLDNRPNYRARTLRGIRRDCRGAVRQVVSRLRNGVFSADGHGRSGSA